MIPLALSRLFLLDSCNRLVTALVALSVHPAAICHHMSAAITHLFYAVHGHSTRNRPEHALKIRAHHAFVLRVHRGSIHLVRLSICTDYDALRMLWLVWRFVFVSASSKSIGRI